MAYPITRCVSVSLLAAFMLPGSSLAAETSYTGGAGLSYRVTDNASVTLGDALALGGWQFTGNVRGAYATPRFNASGNMGLNFTRNNRAQQDSGESSDASLYDNANTRIGANLGYSWELHQVGLNASYYTDSSLNSAFLDTGNVTDGRRKEYGLGASWGWQLTERQSLNTGLSGRNVDYLNGDNPGDSDLDGGRNSSGVDYDSASLNVGWSYSLNPRMSLQLQSGFSWFKNQAEFRAVRSNTFSLQGGFNWSLAERWSFNALVGSTKVYSVYGDDGYFVIIPGPEPGTGQIEFIEIEDQDSSSFTGSVNFGFNEERYNVSASLNSAVVPTGNGVLQQQYRGAVRFTWRFTERLSFDLDSLVGRDSASDERIDSARLYGEAGMRLGYQFLEQWFVNLRYRHRVQRNDSEENVSTQAARSNEIYLGVNYSLPKALFW